MSAKQKVTLYISDDLHRQVKIRSAIDSEPMSSIAQRAIEFYLAHSDVVEQTNGHIGGTHRVHACPKCATPVVLREDGLSLVQSSANQQFETMAADLKSLPGLVPDSSGIAGEGELIVCQ